MSVDEAKRQKLRLLQQRYVAELPQTMAEIQTLWQQLAVEEALESHVQQQTLYRLLHSLAGSAGVFGYMPLSRLAWELEQKLFVVENSSESLAKRLMATQKELSALEQTVLQMMATT